MELSFVNSNLQLLKEELAEINSEVEAYQTDTFLRSVPLIPLGLKETKDIHVKLVFQVRYFKPPSPIPPLPSPMVSMSSELTINLYNTVTMIVLAGTHG